MSKETAETRQIEIEREIQNRDIVKETRLISSTQALERFQERFPNLQVILENIDLNPFPSSVETTLQDREFAAGEIEAFIDSIRSQEGIEDIQFNQEWIEKMEALSRLAKAIGFFLGGILILASFFIVSNVIRLNVFARKDEVEILRLVGATNTFIRIPFLFEGIILGVIGGILSLGLIFVLIKIFPLYLGQSLGVLNTLINFRTLNWTQSIALVLAGGFIGLLGSLSSLTRFLKI